MNRRRKWYYCLRLKMIVHGIGLLAGACYRADIIPQPQSIELVVMKLSISLRYYAVEQRVLAAQVEEDLQRNAPFSRRVNC